MTSDKRQRSAQSSDIHIYIKVDLDRKMSKLNGHEQISSIEYASNSMNTNSVGSMSSNSMCTTFPSNHHLLVRHAAVEIVSPSIQYQLNSGNSFEMNGVTSSSLSEDSGLPLTTNSSISSGDSTRMGICKFEFEVRIIIDMKYENNWSIEFQLRNEI